MLCSTLVESFENGMGSDLPTALLVAAHGSERQTQRKRGIGISARAFNRKARLRNFSMRLLLHLSLRLDNFAYFTGGGIHQLCQIEHWILHGFDCLFAAFEEFLTESHISHFGALDQLGSAFPR